MRNRNARLLCLSCDRELSIVRTPAKLLLAVSPNRLRQTRNFVRRIGWSVSLGMAVANQNRRNKQSHNERIIPTTGNFFGYRVPYNTHYATLIHVQNGKKNIARSQEKIHEFYFGLSRKKKCEKMKKQIEFLSKFRVISVNRTLAI